MRNANHVCSPSFSTGKHLCINNLKIILWSSLIVFPGFPLVFGNCENLWWCIKQDLESFSSALSLPYLPFCAYACFSIDWFISLCCGGWLVTPLPSINWAESWQRVRFIWGQRVGKSPACSVRWLPSSADETRGRLSPPHISTITVTTAASSCRCVTHTIQHLINRLWFPASPDLAVNSHEPPAGRPFLSNQRVTEERTACYLLLIW